jgi:hypothetical protein
MLFLHEVEGFCPDRISRFWQVFDTSEQPVKLATKKRRVSKYGHMHVAASINRTDDT